MPETSRWTVPVPEVSLSTYIFGSPSSPISNGLAFVDIDDPSRRLRLTWLTLRLWSQRFAAGITAAGLNQGDRVLVYSPNNIFFPVLVHGTIMAGGIFSAANARFVPRELAYQLQLTSPKFVLASRDNLTRALEAVRIAGIKTTVFLFDHMPLATEDGGVDDKETGVSHWKALLASKDIGAKFCWEELTVSELKRRTIGLLFSSGTTGFPKGVESSHYNLVSCAAQINHVMSLDLKVSTRELSSQNSRWLCSIPLYHGLGLCYFLIVAPLRRIPTYIMRQYQVDPMLEAIQKYKITELHLVPPIAVEMTKSKSIKSGKVDLSSVKGTFSCGAPLGPMVTLEYERIWPAGAMNVKQAFGMTELNGIALGCDPTVLAPPGSVGKPMPNVEVKLVDDNYNEARPGESGELCVRCPNIMKGYWEKKEATSETITVDGWLKTGDIAVRDHEGWYFIIGRRKELIKVKGNQVAPAELETLLLDHPAVLDAAVIGVKAGEDEVPRAYVVPASPVTEQEIQDYMNKLVSSVKRLRGGVYFTNSIPKNPSGKIVRQVLQEISKKTKLEPKL